MDPQYKWEKVLEYIKDQVSSANYKAWFYNTQVTNFNPDKISIKVPSAFVKNQLITRYNNLVTKAVEELFGYLNLEIEYQIDPSLVPPKKVVEEKVEEDIFNFNYNSSPTPSSPLNPKYKLDNFIVGLTNNLAFAAAQAVVQNPGSLYNPLFIYGPSGVGKTHLMQGVGNALLERNPYLKIHYAPSERFTNEFVESLQGKKTGDFRQKYRNVDILLIDDIQFIAGKESTQEEFFHTFNDLYSRNAQIILTSDRPPTEMQKLESRLVSRFQGGLMVDIQLPDFETRVGIIRARLSERGESLPDESIQLIAESIESNIRELEGKLIQIVQISKLQHVEPTPENISKFLGKPQLVQNRNLDYKKVINNVNQYFNIKMTDLIGPRRQKEIVLPRQITMFLLYEECNIPMERIGQILGGRDHTTVLHGIEKIKDVLKRDREVQRMVVELKQQIIR